MSDNFIGRAVVREETVMIPTYAVGAPDKNPMFIEKRVYQGSTGKIYPYPTTQTIAKEKKDMPWQAVILENEYIYVMVLPQLGGRIQRAYDKTNGYDFVYYNRVIKPALVGLLGPWISGGIEFNWPQHHRPTTYMPVEYECRQNEDGSCSVLLNDVDQINGTKVVTTITVRPGVSRIEITGQLYNGTALPQTFLWWANPAVSVNDDTKSIFPSDVHNVYDHGKRDVSRFPMATGVYYKHDYSEGIDISRYRNIPVPTSYMAAHSEFDFVGNYDFGRQAGLLHVADHHISPGKKQWTWGNGDFGRAWDRNLTDEDGPYIELMTGMYCDNQPDFAWLKPYEEKTFTQYFMPYKQVGEVSNASIDAAMNVDVREGGVHVCVYATSLFEGATVKVTYDGKEVCRDSATLSPNDIYEKLLPVGVEDPSKLCVSVIANGRTLVKFRPAPEAVPEIAEAAKAPEAPERVRTNEELYYIGQHLEQYRHATWLPDAYYLEGLKRDPADVRINDAYGLLLLRRGCFEEAEKYFRRALERLVSLNPTPYDSEPYYHLGLALYYQNDLDKAFDAFYKASWTNEQRENAYYYLGAIAARRGDYEDAVAFFDLCLQRNVRNVCARALKAACILRTGDKDRALAQIADNLSVDPFDYVSRVLGHTITGEGRIAELIGENVERYLQAARDLMAGGFCEEALGVLKACRTPYPPVAYYAGACYNHIGEHEEALKAYRAAEAMSPNLCFPNKLEDIAVLEHAIEVCPEGGKAMYYLGNLWYDRRQYDRAMALWEKALVLDPEFPTVFRNMAIACYNKSGDATRALELMERAFALDTSDARVFLELDQLRRKAGMSFEARYRDYEAHIELIELRDDLYTEYVTLLNQLERYDDAHDMIVRHEFATWEGAEGKITGQFKVCLKEKAKLEMAKGDFAKAEAHIREALSYPENLGEGKLEGTLDNDLWYILGECLDMQGKDGSTACYERASLGVSDPAGVMYYYDQPADMILYQGLAHRKLGNASAANARFYKLLDYGEKHLNDTFVMDYFAVSMPDFTIFDEDMTRRDRAHCHYLRGLGLLGLGKSEKAAACFKSALDLEPCHQNAAIYLRMAQGAI